MACDPTLPDLPQALLLQIFSYLSPRDIVLGVRQTCRYFHGLSFFADLWTHLSIIRLDWNKNSRKDREFLIKPFRFYYKLLNQECISEACDQTEGRPKRRKKIGKEKCSMRVKNVVTSLKEKGKVWRSLSTTQKMFCPNLRQLTLMRNRLPSMDFLAKYPALVFLCLELSHLDRATENFVSLFQSLAGLKSLQTLEINIEHLDEFHLQPEAQLVRVSMIDYFETGPRLRRIELSSLVNDIILTIILNYCLQLKDLRLFQPNLTASAFTGVSQEPKLLLSSLRVKHCKSLTDKSLWAMARAFPNLNCLELTLTRNMKIKQIRAFLRALRQLTSLHLTLSSSFPHVNDEHVNGIGAKCFSEFANLGNCHHLVLDNASPCRPLLCESMFEKLCQHHRNLRSIQLSYWDINNSHIMILADNCSLLKTVKIKGSQNVDSAGVMYLMKKLPRLQKFSWIICKDPDKTEFEMEKMQPPSKRTRSGKLVWPDQLQTEGSLQSLVIYPCSRLSSTAVSILALYCPHLLELTLHTTDGTDDTIIRAILRTFPQLQNLELEVKKREGNLLTGKSLHHIQTWGTRLQRLKLVIPRSFSNEALIKLLTQSSTIGFCAVNASRMDQPGESATSTKRAVMRTIDQLTGFRERIHVWISERFQSRSRSSSLIRILNFHILQE